MEQVALGNTGLMVNPAGLGCGGYSRLGMRDGGDASIAEGVIRKALDLGINFFDTARAYGTEEVLGKTVQLCRDEVIISTKTMFQDREGNYMPAERLVASLERSLERMQTDRVEVFSFHGVTLEHLQYCLEVYVPVLQKEIEKGKIRHLGITESFMHDPTHEMLKAAIPSGAFDVVMVGFNFLNPCARDEVFPLCIKHGVATQIMHAVRRALSNEEVLLETVQQLIKSGEVSASGINADDPLDFLKSHGDIASVTQAAYRFCRHEPGVSVVLNGTGSQDHLVQNVAAIYEAGLPGEIQERLLKVFGRVRSVSGD